MSGKTRAGHHASPSGDWSRMRLAQLALLTVVAAAGASACGGGGTHVIHWEYTLLMNSALLSDGDRFDCDKAVHTMFLTVFNESSKAVGTGKAETAGPARIANGTAQYCDFRGDLKVDDAARYRVERMAFSLEAFKPPASGIVDTGFVEKSQLEKDDWIFAPLGRIPASSAAPSTPVPSTPAAPAPTSADSSESSPAPGGFTEEELRYFETTSPPPCVAQGTCQ